MARVCREAGARVRENQLVRELNLEVPAGDARKIEVIANGLPFWGGKQLAVDTTVVSALRADGSSRGGTGTALRDAETVKHRTYADIARSDRCRLVVAAFEVAGRWSNDAVEFVRLLASHKVVP